MKQRRESAKVRGYFSLFSPSLIEEHLYPQDITNIFQIRKNKKPCKQENNDPESRFIFFSWLIHLRTHSILEFHLNHFFGMTAGGGGGEDPLQVIVTFDTSSTQSSLTRNAVIT